MGPGCGDGHRVVRQFPRWRSCSWRGPGRRWIKDPILERILRIRLPEGNAEFLPYSSSQLNDELISVFKSGAQRTLRVVRISGEHEFHLFQRTLLLHFGGMSQGSVGSQGLLGAVVRDCEDLVGGLELGVRAFA